MEARDDDDDDDSSSSITLDGHSPSFQPGLDHHWTEESNPQPLALRGNKPSGNFYHVIEALVGTTARWLMCDCAATLKKFLNSLEVICLHLREEPVQQ